MIDILIKNGKIVDGTNAPGYQGDIAVLGDRIVDIGKFNETSAEKVIDAADRVVVPGFIDMHSHADLSLLAAPEGESLIQQGITTVVGGQCGLSPAPLTKANKKEAARTINIVGAPKTAMPFKKVASFGQFLDHLDSLQPSVNFISLVGQGMVRSSVLGYSNTTPSKEQLSEMQDLVNDALKAGAFGISSGLIYPPGAYTSTDELIEIVKPAADYGGIYFSHIRGEAGTLLNALEEAIKVGRGAGVAVQISHYKAGGRANWESAASGLTLIEEARDKGLDITMDMYPYTAGSTSLAALLPPWAVEGGMTSVFKRLLVPWTRRKIIREMKSGRGSVVEQIEWDKVIICRSRKTDYTLRTIEKLAEAENKDPYIWTLDALIKTLGDIGMVIQLISEDNIRMQLVHQLMMIGTDGFGMATEGPMSTGMLHPRCFGTYPRIFGKYVREEGILSLEEASWKTSGYPAQKLGLTDRGFIKKGFKADLVIFDPLTIRDKATYSDPLHYPVGIDAVLVNGRVSLKGGVQSKNRTGRVIRKGTE